MGNGKNAIDPDSTYVYGLRSKENAIEEIRRSTEPQTNKWIVWWNQTKIETACSHGITLDSFVFFGHHAKTKYVKCGVYSKMRYPISSIGFYVTPRDTMANSKLAPSQ